jgi:hypothetical protein
MIIVDSFPSDKLETRCFYEPKDDIEVHELAEIVPYLIKASKVWDSYQKGAPISPELVDQLSVQSQRHFRKPHVG